MSSPAASVAVAPRPDQRSRRRLAWAAGALVAFALVTGAVAAFTAWSTSRELHGVRTDVGALSLDDLSDTGHLVATLDQAAHTSRRAAERMDDDPWVALWRSVPIAGSQLTAVERLARVTAEATALTHETARRLHRSHSTLDRGGRIGALTDIEDALSRLRRDLSALRLPTSRVLLPPITGARDALRGELRSADKALGDAGEGIQALASLLEGPTEVLVLAANNAEMRSSGMVLSAGMVPISDGALGTVAFVPTEELAPDAPVAVPNELADLYGWLEPGRDWRNTGTSPNFPAVAPVYRGLARSIGLGTPDAVVQVDVVALRLLLEALGPVTVRDIPVSAERVEAALLNRLYLRFPGQPDLRRALEHEVAGAVFAALDERSWDLGKLVWALATAVERRHLMAWSAVPEVQGALLMAGAGGSLDSHGLLLAVQNHSGGKLDWYVDVGMEIHTTSRSGGGSSVGIEVTIVNDAPRGLPPYVAGSGQGGVPPGDYRAFVTAYLPADATAVQTNERVLVQGRDGPMRVVAVRVDVPRGEAWRGQIRFDLPAGHEPLRFIPSGRSNPVPVRIDGEETFDTARPNIFR